MALATPGRNNTSVAIGTIVMMKPVWIETPGD
jgi:hypothetical protein